MGHVKCVILDYPDKRYPICFVEKVMRESLEGLDVEILVNTTHFGEITKEELKQFGDFDKYAGGNLDVLKHLESLGVKCEYWPRSYAYAASKIELDN